MVFLFFQQEGREEIWSLAPADSREAIVRDKNPRFVTVFDVDTPVDAMFTMEQLNACRYKGRSTSISTGNFPKSLNASRSLQGSSRNKA